MEKENNSWLKKDEEAILLDLQSYALTKKPPEKFSYDDIASLGKDYFDHCLKIGLPPDITDFSQKLGFTAFDLASFFRSEKVDTEAKRQLLFIFEKIIAFWTRQNKKYHNKMTDILLYNKLTQMADSQEYQASLPPDPQFITCQKLD